MPTKPTINNKKEQKVSQTLATGSLKTKMPKKKLIITIILAHVLKAEECNIRRNSMSEYKNDLVKIADGAVQAPNGRDSVAHPHFSVRTQRQLLALPIEFRIYRQLLRIPT